AQRQVEVALVAAQQAAVEVAPQSVEICFLQAVCQDVEAAAADVEQAGQGQPQPVQEPAGDRLADELQIERPAAQPACGALRRERVEERLDARDVAAQQRQAGPG